MIDFRVIKPGELGVVTVTGQLSADKSFELKAALIRSLQSVKHVVFDLEDVTEADVSALLLLCSAYRIAMTLDKRFTLSGEVPGVIKSAIEASGRCRLKGCLQGDETCMFLKGFRAP